MQFSIPTKTGKTTYKPHTHSRDELKFAFRELRKAGHTGDSILLSAIYGELFPATKERLHKAWKEKYSQ